MNHPENPEEGQSLSATTSHGAVTTGQTYFPEAEWQSFRESDKTAAKYIVGLMVGIFIVGLFLYAGVALWVSARPTY